MSLRPHPHRPARAGRPRPPLRLAPGPAGTVPADGSNPPPPPPSPGDWLGIHGRDGYWIAGYGGGPSLPSWLDATVSDWVEQPWADPTTDPRGLQKPIGPERIAGYWVGGPITFDLAVRDGQAHPLAVYALDWDGYGGGRSIRIDLVDAGSGHGLATQTLASYTAGVWWTTTLSGSCRLVITNLNPASNAVLSGVFFG